MPCSTSRANLSVFNTLRVILDTKTSECDWKFHLSTAPRAGEWAVTAGTRRQARRGQRRKTTAGSGLRTRGQTGLAWISGKMRRKSMPVLSVPGALVGGDEVSMAVFHELSRAEGSSQQAGQSPDRSAGDRLAGYSRSIRSSR